MPTFAANLFRISVLACLILLRYKIAEENFISLIFFSSFFSLPYTNTDLCQAVPFTGVLLLSGRLASGVSVDRLSVRRPKEPPQDGLASSQGVNFRSTDLRTSPDSLILLS